MPDAKPNLLSRSLAWLRDYADHPDPATAVANLVAIIVGGNGPFYPLFVVLLAGREVVLPSLLTALAFPFFLAIPALSRRWALGARIAMPLVGIANTLWCMKVLGPDAGVDLFLLPCTILAALLYRPRERMLLFLFAGLPLAAHFLAFRLLGTPIMDLAPSGAEGLTALNAGSVATLSFVLAIQFAGLLRRPNIV